MWMERPFLDKKHSKKLLFERSEQAVFSSGILPQKRINFRRIWNGR